MKAQRKRVRLPFVTGYHGTRKDAAERILAEGFKKSENDWEWLGHGVYFWQDGPARAKEWARTWLGRKGYQGADSGSVARESLEACSESLC